MRPDDKRLAHNRKKAEAQKKQEKANYDELVELWARDFAASITPDQLDHLAEICLDMAPAKFEIAGRTLREARESDVSINARALSDEDIRSLRSIAASIEKELEIEGELRDLWRSS